MYVMMNWLIKLITLFVLSWVCHCESTNILHETVVGIVGAENYTYYTLVQPGTVYIFLRSHTGDADLYVSQKDEQPTYDIDNHDLQSTTCGLDFLQVPHTFHRPISIAVYGHPSNDVSIFEMKIVIDDSLEVDPIISYDSDNEDGSSIPETTRAPTLPKTDQVNESESLLWTVLLGMLKVLFDVLV